MAPEDRKDNIFTLERKTVIKGENRLVFIGMAHHGGSKGAIAHGLNG